MFDKEQLLSRPNYLHTKWQNEIYNQLVIFKNTTGLTENGLALAFGKSERYIKKILNGNANMTVKDLIEFGIVIGKVPYIEFVNPDEYWKREEIKVFGYENKMK